MAGVGVAGMGRGRVAGCRCRALAAPQAIPDAIVLAKIGHPVQQRDDQTVTLVATGGAHYAGDVDLRPGLWDVDLTVTGPKGEIWTHSIRFLVKG